MAGPVREKFATQMKAALLAEVRAAAQADKRELQAVLEDAVAEWLDRRRGPQARPHVVRAYLESVERYDAVYRGLSDHA